MSKLCFLLNITSQTHRFLYPPFPVAPSCPWTLCPFLLRRWRFCYQTSTQIQQLVQTASAHVSEKPVLLLVLTLSLLYSPSHFLKVICHLLGNRQTLPLCTKKVQKQIAAMTDPSACSQSSARSWNPSSPLTSNSSSSPMASFLTINLDSIQVTLPWTCCFCFPTNGWRSEMPDVRSESSPKTYCCESGNHEHSTYRSP